MTSDGATVQWDQAQPGLRGLVFDPVVIAVRYMPKVTDTGSHKIDRGFSLPCGDFSHYRRQRGIHRA